MSTLKERQNQLSCQAMQVDSSSSDEDDHVLLCDQDFVQRIRRLRYNQNNRICKARHIDHSQQTCLDMGVTRTLQTPELIFRASELNLRNKHLRRDPSFAEVFPHWFCVRCKIKTLVDTQRVRDALSRVYGLHWTSKRKSFVTQHALPHRKASPLLQNIPGHVFLDIVLLDLVYDEYDLVQLKREFDALPIHLFDAISRGRPG